MAGRPCFRICVHTASSRPASIACLLDGTQSTGLNPGATAAAAPSSSAEAGLQRMTDPFLLPAPCLERILQRQDPLSELCFPWGTFRQCRPLTVRQVSRQARQAVHDIVRALVLKPRQRDQDRVTSLPAWLRQCWQLQQLIYQDKLVACVL